MISLPNRKAWPALLALVALVLLSVGCKNFFTDPKLTSVAVTPATAAIALPGTTQLHATGTYDDSSTKDVTGSVTWSVASTNPAGVAVATVSKTGLVTAGATGSAVIQAVSGTATPGTATVTVNLTLTSITVIPANSTVSKAGTPTVQFTATGNFSDGSTQNLTNSVTWKASGAPDATFSTTTPGLATLVTTGVTTTITATSSAATGSVPGTTQLTINP